MIEARKASEMTARFKNEVCTVAATVDHGVIWQLNEVARTGCFVKVACMSYLVLFNLVLTWLAGGFVERHGGSAVD